MSHVKDTSIITLKPFPDTQGYKPVNHKAAQTNNQQPAVLINDIHPVSMLQWAKNIFGVTFHSDISQVCCVSEVGGSKTAS